MSVYCRQLLKSIVCYSLYSETLTWCDAEHECLSDVSPVVGDVDQVQASVFLCKMEQVEGASARLQELAAALFVQGEGGRRDALGKAYDGGVLTTCCLDWWVHLHLCIGGGTCKGEIQTSHDSFIRPIHWKYFNNVYVNNVLECFFSHLELSQLHWSSLCLQYCGLRSHIDLHETRLCF